MTHLVTACRMAAVPVQHFPVPRARATSVAGADTVNSKLRNLRVGRWAVMLAAYALLLNMALTSTLAASVSPLVADPLHALCLSRSAASSTSPDHDKAHGRVIACPICVGHLASFIAPAVPVLPIRVAIVTVSDPVAIAMSRGAEAPRDCRARAPPAFV